MRIVLLGASVFLFFTSHLLGWSEPPQDTQTLLADMLFTLAMWISGVWIGMGIAAP